VFGSSMLEWEELDMEVRRKRGITMVDQSWLEKVYLDESSRKKCRRRAAGVLVY
jgi:hypothetical protein